MCRLIFCMGAPVMVYGCGAKPTVAVVVAPPPAIVNPTFASTYQSVARDSFGGDSRNSDRAISSLALISQAEPNNAFTFYVIAAAYANKGDWASVTRNLDTGNKAPYCVYYQLDTLPIRETACLAIIRQMALRCAAVSPQLDIQQGSNLLQSVRAMAKHIAGMDPKMTLNPFIAAFARAIADDALVRSYTKAGMTDATARAKMQQHADAVWAQAVNHEVGLLLKDEIDTGIKTRLNISKPEFDAMSGRKPLSPETSKKMDAMTVEKDTVITPVIDKLVQSMPD